ncbi:hypothetical protein [Breoghania sp.]|uniref:hypothetical protein n=1 Tax=Breoghania sp. TaxID=2065378 RepID=UPI002633E0F0|nr:hypothetical protein [Breoghania sp.]MDJ0932952.1 hypothetical protein [Breoghania sp.]
MARALGAVQALQKPFSPEELSEALEASLGAPRDAAIATSGPGGRGFDADLCVRR